MATIAITMAAEAVENALLHPAADGFPRIGFPDPFRSDPVEPGVFILQPDLFREQ
jgi:hypothetical protein